MPLASRDFDPQGKLRERQAKGAQPLTVAPPPPAPEPAGKPALTQQQINRRARKNGVLPPSGSPAAPAGGMGNPATPTSQPGAGGGGGAGAAQLRPGERPPNPASDKLPTAFAKMVAGGKITEEKARRMWANSLQNRGKTGPGIPGTAPPAAAPPPGPGMPAGPAPTPGPAPGTPVGPPMGGGPIPPFGGGGGYAPSPGGAGGGTPGGGMPGAGPYAGPGSPLVTPGQSGGMTDFRDPMMQFLSAVPIMNMNAQKQITGAMAGFGDTGNRWSSTALGKAGEIGAENAMQQNAMMANLLGNYANNQENRALQASQQGLQLGSQLEQAAQDRITTPANIGMWEQGRQDEFSKTAFDDWSANRHGYLPMLLQAAMSQGSGSPGQIYQTQTPSKPGIADWAQLLAGFV